MVRINVSQQLKEPIGSTRSYKIDEAVDISGGESPVWGEVGLMRTDRSILVRGKLRMEVELTCSRCLSPFSCPLDIDFEEEYFPTTDILTGVPVSQPDEPGSFSIDEHNILDLTEAIRQYVLMAVPMKPLCREDCAGLCPVCGSNLNLAPCGCPPRPADPRLAELGKLAFAGGQAPVEAKRKTKSSR